MTHYEISYEHLQEPEKHNKAIQDIIDYLGMDEFSRMTTLIQKEKRWRNDYGNFSLCLELFVGVSGYPAVAWHNYAFGYPPGSTEGDERRTVMNGK